MSEPMVYVVGEDGLYMPVLPSNPLPNGKDVMVINWDGTVVDPISIRDGVELGRLETADLAGIFLAALDNYQTTVAMPNPSLVVH